MSDLIAIGEALVELNQARDGAPFVQGFGGDTSNAMIAAARLGADAAYFTAVGADRFGQALTELWMREGVDASRIVVSGGAHTGLYFVTHGPDGHQFSYMRAGSAASRIAESDLPVDRIRETKILHLSGISQAISSSAADAAFAAIDIAREAKRLVSYDPNLRLKLWPLRRARAIIHEAMRFSDIALPGLDDAEALTGSSDPEAIVDFYLRLGPRVVVLKLGKAGAIVATPKARERVAARTVKAVDATGAGDCFDGAFLAEFVRHRRSVRRRALRQRRRGALDPRLRRGRAPAAPGRRRSRSGEGVNDAVLSERLAGGRLFHRLPAARGDARRRHGAFPVAHAGGWPSRRVSLRRPARTRGSWSTPSPPRSASRRCSPPRPRPIRRSRSWARSICCGSPTGRSATGRR